MKTIFLALLLSICVVARGRVAPGDCSPGAPTDPYVQNYRIRFLK
jgi:hypothetical protein